MGTRTYLAGKIHGVVVTGTQLAYTESVTIGADIMSAAGIDPFQQVEVANLASGERFTTYAVPGMPGTFLVNGAAARMCSNGDRCVVVSYVQADAFAGAPMVTCGTDNSFVLDNAFPYTLSAQSPDQAASVPADPQPQAAAAASAQDQSGPQTRAAQPASEPVPLPADAQQWAQFPASLPVPQQAPADAQQWPDAPQGCLTAGDGSAASAATA